MPELVLIKHSHPAIDPVVPASRWHLSAEGRRRCHQLSEQLRDYQPEVIVASIELKAIETGQVVASILGLDLEIAAGLQEHDRSNAPFFHSSEAFDGAVKRFFEHPRHLVFGNETADEAHVRFEQAVESVLQIHPNKNVAIVAHGTVITLFVSRRFDLDPYSFWKDLTLPSFVVLHHPHWRLQKVVVREQGRPL